MVDPPRWNTADLLIQCFPGEGRAYFAFFIYSALSSLVILLFTLGWPLLTYLTLKHLFDQHAVTVRLGDLPSNEASAIIRSNRPARSEERCARPELYA